MGTSQRRCWRHCCPVWTAKHEANILNSDHALAFVHDSDLDSSFCKSMLSTDGTAFQYGLDANSATP